MEEEEGAVVAVVRVHPAFAAVPCFGCREAVGAAGYKGLFG